MSHVRGVQPLQINIPDASSPNKFLPTNPGTVFILSGYEFSWIKYPKVFQSMVSEILVPRWVNFLVWHFYIIKKFTFTITITSRQIGLGRG